MFDRDTDHKVRQTAQFLLASLIKREPEVDLRDIKSDMAYGQFDSVALELYAKVLKGKVELSHYEAAMLLNLVDLLEIKPEVAELAAHLSKESAAHLARRFEGQF